MVLKCHNYNFGSSRIDCQGTFEECGTIDVCGGQEPFCFAVAVLPEPVKTVNTTLPIATAGCFPKHQNAELFCNSDEQCLAHPQVKENKYKYFGCCRHDACNGKLIAASTVEIGVNSSMAQNITEPIGQNLQNPGPSQSVILLAIILLVTLPALLGFMIRRARLHTKIKKDRNNLLALANRASNNENHENNASALTPFRNSFDNHVQQTTISVQIPKYDLKDVELLELVGSGRFGTVHKANLTRRDNPISGHDSNINVETQNQTTVYEIAVKIIKNNEFQSFQNELNIYGAASTRHPNVLSFLGSCENPQTLSNWLLVEYASNGSLHHYLKENTVSWSEFLEISLGMVRGLSHLHDADVAHRDFKSKNVLLRRNLSPCITDFGVATILDMTGGSQTQQRKNYLQVGTPRYMAPEVLECSVSFTKISFTKIDVYALSLVLWELLSRCFPLPKTKMNDLSNGNTTEDESSRCLVQPYRLPFDEFVGSNPDINTMRQVVVCDKLRPPIKDEWNHYPLSRVSQAIIDGWEYDHDARISASCFVERIESLPPVRLQHHHPTQQVPCQVDIEQGHFHQGLHNSTAQIAQN